MLMNLQYDKPLDPNFGSTITWLSFITGRGIAESRPSWTVRIAGTIVEWTGDSIRCLTLPDEPRLDALIQSLQSLLDRR